MSTNGKDPVQRALDVFVYAPVGLAVMAWQRAPALVSDVIQRGLTQLGEAEANVNRARMIGEVAVTYGSRMVRRDLDARLGGARRRAECLTGWLPVIGDHGDAARTEPAARPVQPPVPGPAAEAPAAPAAAAARTTPRPAPTDLPIPDYDELSASQVVSRLTGLSPSELEAVAAYETAGRARKTVLGAVERLRHS